MSTSVVLGALTAPARFVRSTAGKTTFVGLSTLSSIGIIAWLYFFFWVIPQRSEEITRMTSLFTPERIQPNITWLVIAYLTIGFLAAATITIERGSSILAPVANFLASAAVLVVIAIAFYDAALTMSTAQRYEIGLQLAVMSFAELAGGLIIAFAVTRRRVDFGGSGD